MVHNVELHWNFCVGWQQGAWGTLCMTLMRIFFLVFCWGYYLELSFRKLNLERRTTILYFCMKSLFFGEFYWFFLWGFEVIAIHLREISAWRRFYGCEI